MTVTAFRRAFAAAAVAGLMLSAGAAYAQVPADIEAGLRKIGQIVDPACTAMLYRPLMPKNDFNTYWPPDAPAPVSTEPLYPGVTITRDQSFGPDPKDVLDIFVGRTGGRARPVVVYVPGGGGNKIEQQVREANAFYDNIGRWATRNGMVGVIVQRHQGRDWDDGGRDLSRAVDWIRANIGKFNGDTDHIFMWAHSAGNGPLGTYVGHPERWDNGVQIRGAIFMSGNPVPTIGGGRGPAGPPQGGKAPGEACGVSAGMASNDGRIAGPSGQAAPLTFGGRGRGARPGGPPQLTPAQQAERDNLPAFKRTDVAIMLAYAELDPGVNGKMPDAAVALHDELCKVDGARAQDGYGHCPEMLFGKGESHMSEVFSIDTDDTTVSGPILEWIRSNM